MAIADIAFAFVRKSLASRVVDIGGEYDSALACEQSRRGSADARCRAGDDRSLASKSHVILPVISRLQPRAARGHVNAIALTLRHGASP